MNMSTILPGVFFFDFVIFELFLITLKEASGGKIKTRDK